MKQRIATLSFFLLCLSACQKNLTTIADNTDLQPASSPQATVASKSLITDNLLPGGTFSPVPASGGGVSDPETYDPDLGFIDYPLTWDGNYSPRNIIIVMKAGVRVITEGDEITWSTSPLYLPQLVITGGAVGPLTSKTVNFSVVGWEPGVINPYYATAVEQRTYVTTSDGSSHLAVGPPSEYPIGASFSNGYKITSSLSSITDYDMNYQIQFYVQNGIPDYGLQWSYTNNESTITGVPSN